MKSDKEMTADDVAVVVRNLSFGFGRGSKCTVLGNRLDASLKNGELTCIIGPVGAGKSMLAQTIAAMKPSFEGDVYLGGRRTEDCSKSDLSKRIAYFSSEAGCSGNVSVTDYIVYGHKPGFLFHSKMSEKDANAVKRCLNWFGLEDLGDSKMKTLSDGERQKAIMAKAIFCDVPVIILDGQMDSLDFPDNVKTLRLLKRLAHASKKAVAVVMRNVELALQFADRIWLVDRDHGFASGIPEDLCLLGKIEESFGCEDADFDVAGCRFVFKDNTLRSVLVEGDDSLNDYISVCRALRRCAVEPVVAEGSADASALKVVVKGNGQFTLHRPDSDDEKFTSIEHLLNAVSSAMSKLRLSILAAEEAEDAAVAEKVVEKNAGLEETAEQ